MPTPILNAFIGATRAPVATDLERALGPAKPAGTKCWPPSRPTTTCRSRSVKSYSPKTGWVLRLKRGKRTILWLTPSEGCFLVVAVLGAKAVLAARECGLSARAIQALDQAEKYPEGTGVRLILEDATLPSVVKLASVKLAN